MGGGWGLKRNDGEWNISLTYFKPSMDKQVAFPCESPFLNYLAIQKPSGSFLKCVLPATGLKKTNKNTAW